MRDEVVAMQQDGLKSAIPRLDRIDLLRGFSILMVILSHTVSFLPAFRVSPGINFPLALYTTLFDNGHYGVWIFFSISGFLITLTSIRRFRSLQQLNPATFYRIRFARIAPVLLSFLAVMSVLDLAHVPFYTVGPEFGPLHSILFAALTFQINWLQALHGWLPLSWLVLWSLSVEEMFYLFFPLACLLLRRRWSVPIVVALLLLLLRLGPLSRWPASSANEVWQNMSYLGNMDMIVIGCIFGFLADRLGRVPWQRAPRLIGVFELAGLVALLYMAIHAWTWPHTALLEHVRFALARRGLHVDVVAVAAGLLMTGGVLRSAHGSKLTLPLRWMGRHSYEIYLTHMFVIIGLNPYTLRWHLPLPAWLFIVVVLSAVPGYLVSRFLSEPANRLLRGAPLPFQLRRSRKARATSPTAQ